MDTQWGEMPVCDAHVHFFSHRFFSSYAEQKQLPLRGLETLLNWQFPDPNPTQLADRWIEELDRWGVSRAALIASIPGDHESVSIAVARHPQRFRGYMTVNPLNAYAAAEAEAALAGGHMHGICFFPAMHCYSMHDDRVAELVAVAAAHPGTVVFVHCGVLTVGIRDKLALPSFFDLRYSNPVDLHAVASRHPQIRFVVPHFGAGFLREALMLCDLCPNVWLDTSSSNSWVKYEAAHTDLRSVFRRALEVVGPGRLLFGTDSSFFPRGWNYEIFQAQARMLYQLGLNEEKARMILHDNFVGLFG
jgi:predicted TIM-barrel fold metal-dependent hydrolase